MHVTVNENIQKFEREQKRIYWRFWNEEIEGVNNIYYIIT